MSYDAGVHFFFFTFSTGSNIFHVKQVSYVDGDTEVLNLKTQKWKILTDFSVRDEVRTR